MRLSSDEIMQLRGLSEGLDVEFISRSGGNVAVVRFVLPPGRWFTQGGWIKSVFYLSRDIDGTLHLKEA